MSGSSNQETVFRKLNTSVPYTSSAMSVEDSVSLPVATDNDPPPRPHLMGLAACIIEMHKICKHSKRLRLQYQ
jgi:hypothetical protein